MDEGVGVRMFVCVCMYAYMCLSLTYVCVHPFCLFITHVYFQEGKLLPFSSLRVESLTPKGFSYSCIELCVICIWP